MIRLAVCSVGSTDPWNAAGLGLDIRALAECGVRPLTIVAGITAQDRRGISRTLAVAPEIIAAQFAALNDADIRAYRVGALLDAVSVEVVAAQLAARAPQIPVVYDPVLAASGGGAFADESTRAALVEHLLPRTTLLTPNIAEAEQLTGLPVDSAGTMEAAAQALRARGSAAVLIKGGHLPGEPADVLVWSGGTIVFEAPRLEGTLRGTGCLFACGAAAALARGESLPEAVTGARAFVRAKFAWAEDVGGMRLAY